MSIQWLDIINKLPSSDIDIIDKLPSSDIDIIDKLPSSDHLPVGLVVSTCVTADKLDSVPTEKQGGKSFIFLNGLKHMIIT